MIFHLYFNPIKTGPELIKYFNKQEIINFWKIRKNITHKLDKYRYYVKLVRYTNVDISPNYSLNTYNILTWELQTHDTE